MANVPTIAMALATPTASIDVPTFDRAVPDVPHLDKLAAALLTPPDSLSPELCAHAAHAGGQSPPPMNIGQNMGAQAEEANPSLESSGMPLSRGALSGLDAAAAITPAMLAKYHLPGIMLGNGPRPIRYVMGELTQTVPGFSRIPPAKARRLVVAALENRSGGGVDGNVTFCKTSWGRWDAHVKGSSRDSGIGSYESRLSPPPSERSGYAMSHGDSATHIPGAHLPSGARDQHSSSWSSIHEEDEFAMDMDFPENEADKMSLDEAELDDGDSSTSDDATDIEENLPPTGSRMIPQRPPLQPHTGARKNYNAISASYARRWSSSKTYRRPSTFSDRPPLNRGFHSSSLPVAGHLGNSFPVAATPEEQAAAAALLSMGSM